MSDFSYRTSEWEIEGALLCADVALTLTVETIDNFGIRHEPVFTLADACLCDCAASRPAWLDPFMTAWVAANQSKLAKDYHSQSSRARAA